MQDYHFYKEENDDFQKEINLTLKFDNYIAKKKNPYNENARRDNAFKDIISKYKKKGYKIPDLSTEKNLFKTSALLIDDAELKQFFKLKKGSKENKTFEDKETFFISKVNNLIYDRLKELDNRVDPSRYKNLERFQTNNYQANMIGAAAENEDLFVNKKLKDIKKNIKILKDENEIIKNNIYKIQENFDILNESDCEMKNKHSNSPKKKPKIKNAYDEFLKRISKPKHECGPAIENKKFEVSELLKRLTNRISLKNRESIQKINKAENEDTPKEKKSLYNNFISNIKSRKGDIQNSNSIFGAIMRSTISTNFDSVFYISLFKIFLIF